MACHDVWNTWPKGLRSPQNPTVKPEGFVATGGLLEAPASVKQVYLPTSFRVTSLAHRQSYERPSANEEILTKNMGKDLKIEPQMVL